MQMTTERWRQIKTIYQQAAETASNKRRDFLAEVCGGDADLRREVESMLEFQIDSEKAFEKPIFEVAVQLLTKDETLPIGERIDNYRIVKEIGRGGMGLVYLAERVDGLFDQKVALKIIKRGMDTDAILKRFVMERQILASLEHPFIARLLDGGTTYDGLPYFVLEYVEGSSVLEFCESKNLSLNERLQLFRKICDAVTYAHQNLVVHRDLKPSNILVNKNGEPKLLDFGIAKLLHAESSGETEFTETGNRMLTPEYASPEQISGERVTTQSDVYSLGVLLSKLVRSPKPEARSRSRFQISHSKFQNRKYFETRNLESETDNEQNAGKQRPKTDLQAIMQTALREDILKRYSSVEQLSDDIRRHLEGLPVTAQKDSFAYKAAKFVYRNQFAVFAAAFVILALTAAAAFSVWQMQKANAAQSRAEQRFNEVRKLAGNVIFDYHDKIENLSGSTEIRGLMLKDSLAYLDSLAQESGNDAELSSEIGRTYLKIGDVQGKPFAANEGDTRGAMESYSKAERIFLGLTERELDNHDFKIELSRAYTGIGRIQMRDFAADEALEAHQKAINLRQNLLAKNPADTNLHRLLAESFFDLGDAAAVKSGLCESDEAGLKKRIKLTSESLELFRRALAIQRDLLDKNPNDAARIYEVVRIFQRIGFRFESLGNLKKTYYIALPNDNRSPVEFFREAVGFHQKAIETARALQKMEPDNAKIYRFIADEQMILAEPLTELGELDKAEKSLHEASIIFEELAAKDTANIEAQRDLVNLYDRVGRVFIIRKNTAEAVKNFQKAARILEQIVAVNLTESDKIQLRGLKWRVENSKYFISRQSK